ncbi:Putative 1-phosphatidylinositol-3-phosphate 5-kinase FAB1C [Seminavis robusta]|uniref:1-phosphatidylinositol-3-phosphate 5-kinase n=1 Tax=Seminavis robusta TaxID=568900 RepID=A0A9N8HRD8_9STRA|nr:Putative 1-phosphatidylinositol-3-phosphate 5-kinase FAB1C [Seminavis robusta]|eukprot:Sro1262_g257150.1 Putative 1-phosphatidylinositol-3-phosphate 5-kinase FAB1C (1872) ;mRNA; r:23383-29719
MLSNYLWGSTGVGASSYWGGIGDDYGDNRRRKNLSALIRDEEEKDLEGTVQDLDELADRLLTQFPAYGTNNTQDDDEDWLNDDDDDTNDDEEEEDEESKLDPQNNHNGHQSIIPASLTAESSSRLHHAFPGMLLSMEKSHKNKHSSIVQLSTNSNNNKNNPNSTVTHTHRDWDYDEQTLWKAVEGEEKSNHEPRKTQHLQQQQWMYGRNNSYHQQPDYNNNDSNNNNNTVPTSADGPHDFYNSRQHWMPDQLCKHCYLCDTPFTVFRRRHHCRLCGQVFCSSCSSFFVPSQKKGNATLRTCRVCYEQVAEKGGLLMDGTNNKDGTAGNSTNDTSNASTTTATSDATGTTGNSNNAGNNSNATAAEDKRDETGRPVVTDHKTLTIPQTSPKRPTAKKDPDASNNATTAGNNDDMLATKPAWMVESRDQNNTSLEYPTQAHWRAAIRQDQHTHNQNNNCDNHNHSNNAQDNNSSSSEANRHLGLTAANHLEKMGESLLRKDAPLLRQEIEEEIKSQRTTSSHIMSAEKVQKQWLQKLMTLATRCCATVEPNVKKGDLLDIRPYVKIKVIPGGSFQDCAYLSGIVFRKTVSHKRMAKEIQNPKIMLLSGGIEFTRTENRFASLHTLLEQENKYMEILVGRILKLKPDVLCVGRSVSRRALELFLKANVVLIQHVKSTLMSRISRQTGATIISSTDHIMNQFGAHVLGECSRFRLVTFRDSEIWVDPFDHDEDVYNATSSVSNSQQRSIRNLLRKQDLANHERQAALAANVLGDSVVDGAEAIKAGLAKRGVANTFVMLEGCPKHLGCSVVLRGASRAALKQVKRAFRFLVNVAYSLRLETSYLKERCARIRPDFQLQPKHIFSSSLCVDYGSPQPGRKMVRPWNGGSNEASQRSLSGEITAFDHQSILITSVWMTEKTQCCPAEVKGICYYSLQDVSLGQFLRDSCFNLSLKCQNPACKKSVDDHSLLFVHKDGVIKITVEHMDGPLPPPTTDTKRKADDNSKDDSDGKDEVDSPIATWTYCKHCAKVVTPLVYISENTWKLSFGKFLEIFFYNRDAVMNSSEYHCSCPMQTGTMLYFGCGKLAARFSYERVRPLGVYVRKSLPIDLSYHKREALFELERISMSSSKLFVKFDKHIDRVAREARSLFGSAANRPEHLQTVLSELNRIGSEVDHAALTLQEKIASVSDKCRRDGEGVVNEGFLRFPWFSRRYLFMLTSAWNERLSAAGQAIVAMKKLASSASHRGDGVIGPNAPLAGTEELTEAMRRLRQLNEVYSHYNVTDITTVLPTIPGKQEEEDYDDFEDVDASVDFVADGVDADVLASRRRLNNSKSMGTGAYSHLERGQTTRGQLHKTLGTQRSFDSSLVQNESTNAQPRVTPGGAVKSAISRFFNRSGRESDPYQVDLGIFKEGRPRLEPGVNGLVVPVVDDQLCTVIAYSLASSEYARQFKSFAKIMENYSGELDEAGQPIDPLPSPSASASKSGGSVDERKTIEQRMLVRAKTHIKHTFRDYDEKGMVTCKFVCTTYWATQFHAVRQVFLSQSFGRKEGSSAGSSAESDLSMDVESAYVQSLSSAFSWAASGGKSGASFARTSDDRFVIKCISRTELQMFLDCAPAYFEYLSKAFFHGLPTVLCKIVGVYQIGYHNRETGKRSMEQVAVMQNIFYDRKISRVFDLKGSLRGRFAAQVQSSKEDARSETPPLPSDTAASASGHPNRHGSDVDSASRSGEKSTVPERSEADDTGTTQASNSKGSSSKTQLDGDFLEFTRGRPMPLADRAKSLFHMSIQNDTLFLSIINVLDYSILVGIDEEKMELVVGIIDFMRQYDILKQMERVGKSLPMVVGSEAPTIIQPPLYKARFTNAMERYFMTVPCKWTTI